MEFSYTAEQEELIRTLRAFARKELAPRAAQLDRTAEFPWGTWRQMGELGLLGLRTPAAWGGQEADLVTMGIAIEEVARGDFNASYGIQLAGLAGDIISKNGTDEVKRRWLSRNAGGEAVIALALTEPSVGSDAANLVCRAERDGDAYVITGEKSGITLGMAAHATILFARTGGGDKAHGVTAFLVPLDLPGVSRSPLHDMGSRGAVRAVLSFDHVRIPASHRLGEEGTGFYQVMQGFDYNRILIALSCLGVAQISLEETMTYVKERRAFGKTLATFEGVSFPLAEAATHLDAARWLSYRGLWLADRGQPYTKESAMAKWWAPRLSVETIHQCLLFHGHYGYTDELPFERRLRDVIGLEIGDGTAEVMKVIVARELMGRES
ncbi:MAG: acyl-CoA dehydrogenase family protein, partial [Candidatus Rokubacteria bacterium]|nr:acyl-CoA dehydrogenase family protein [Candidatus Rokubacteria bacterium]